MFDITTFYMTKNCHLLSTVWYWSKSKNQTSNISITKVNKNDFEKSFMRSIRLDPRAVDFPVAHTNQLSVYICLSLRQETSHVAMTSTNATASRNVKHSRDWACQQCVNALFEKKKERKKKTCLLLGQTPLFGRRGDGDDQWRDGSRLTGHCVSAESCKHVPPELQMT